MSQTSELLYSLSQPILLYFDRSGQQSCLYTYLAYLLRHVVDMLDLRSSVKQVMATSISPYFSKTFSDSRQANEPVKTTG